jgi:hypothetical protein
MEQTIPIGIGNEGREVFWNAQGFEPFLFLLTAVAVAIFAYGVYRRWALWKAMGKEEIRWDELSGKNKISHLKRTFADQNVERRVSRHYARLNLFWFFCFNFRSRFRCRRIHMSRNLCLAGHLIAAIFILVSLF